MVSITASNILFIEKARGFLLNRPYVLESEEEADKEAAIQVALRMNVNVEFPVDVRLFAAVRSIPAKYPECIRIMTVGKLLA